jgi:hypothetical protein
MVADLFQLFALTYYPELAGKIRNPFIIDPELSLALYTGSESSLTSLSHSGPLADLQGS